jgi:hypothetical protein
MPRRNGRFIIKKLIVVQPGIAAVKDTRYLELARNIRLRGRDVYDLQQL